jgi:hypothetical protein
MRSPFIFDRCECCGVSDTSFNGVVCSRRCRNDYQKIHRYRSLEHYERWSRRYAARLVRRGDSDHPTRVEWAQRILSGEHVPTPRPGPRVRQIFEERGLKIWWLDER